MSPVLPTILTIALLATSAWADQNSDVSLEREVDKYLEKSASAWDDPDTLRPNWKHGIYFESSDGAFKIKIGGRLMWDTFWGTQGSNDFGGTKLAAAGNGSFFRRVRLYIGGTVYTRTIFAVQVEFAGGIAEFRNVYLGLTKLWGSGGTLRFGHLKEYFSLYVMTSSRFIQMMERPMPVSTFAPGYNSGVGLHSDFANKRLYAGAFWGYGESGLQGQFMGNGGGVFTLRFAGLVFHDKDHKTLLHLGASGSYRNYSTNMTQFRTRPDVGGVERVVDTGLFPAESGVLWDFEFLFIWRSVDLIAEVLGAETTGPGAAEDHSFWGWYVELGWWITGESKAYSTKTFALTRTLPKRNFRDGQGGWGAWQLVVRYDFIDLNDKSVSGGETSAISAGLNWHWNPNTRILFNLIYADVKSYGQAGPAPAGSSGELIIFAMRVQFDF